MSATPALRVSDVQMRFGGIIALASVSFDVEPGQICGLIGPNGAGKTTLFNCLSRFYQPSAGAIWFGQQPLLELPRHRIAGLGIGRTFQNLALFGSLSVRRNVMVGVHCRTRGGFLVNALRLPLAAVEDRESAAIADAILERLDLRAVADEPVDSLPFGTKKRVELARALAGHPKLLLLDEPACGLNHEEVEALRKLILALRSAFSLTVLLVEHHMGLVMGISDKVVALNFGRKIADGSPAHVKSNPDVIRAYLGAAA